jgi:hypothetical protein
MYVKFHDDRFWLSRKYKFVILLIWEFSVLVLLMGGIHDIGR